jgi:restriction modification system DNA specificity domain protein
MIKSFDEVFEDVTKLGVKIKTDEYHPIGKYQIIDQGQEAVAGYSDLEDGVFENVPAIVFGDHTRIVKYVDQPFFLGADGVKVLRSRFKDANYRYLYYALKSVKIPNTGYNRHFKWLKEAKIYYPNSEEQSKIVLILDEISSVIEHRQRQLQKLDELVKARFIELFGEPLSNQKGWQTMSIVEAAPIKSQRGDLADEVWLLNLDAVEAQTGTVLFKHKVQSGEINASTVYFTAESVLYSKLRPYLNKVVMPDEDGVATSEMIPMYPLADRLNRAYLCYWLRSDAFVRHISEKVAGAKMPRVSMDYFRSLAIEMPPLELQEQFAAFVEQTDKSKVAVQKALDEAQLLFDSLMQKYFG